MKPLPLQKAMCATCPFRKGSPHSHLAPHLAASACTEAIRICHSTGSNNGINRRTGKPSAVCYGARQIQLRYIASRGVIAAPTEQAWQDTCDRLGVRNGVIYPAVER